MKSSGVLPLLGASDLAAFDNLHSAVASPKSSTVKSISILKSSGNFNRFIAMNSYDNAPKGIKGTNLFVKITLEDGTTGIGGIGYARPDNDVYNRIKIIIGKDPLGFYNWNNKEKITGVASSMQALFLDPKYSWIESPVLDAIGKIKNKPVWELFGEAARDGIDPYDGTVYFEDIAAKTSVDIIAKTGRRIKEDGYRAIKIKLGRPSKWLPGDAGVQRDIDAFIALREAVGNNFLLMADANNGYKNMFSQAVRLMKETAPYHMFFMEELFPDDAGQYRKLRNELLEAGLHIKIAEGEDIRDPKVFDQYMKETAYSYIQPDMQTCGFSYIIEMASKTAAFPHMKLIPHVWQTQMGLIMSLHASKIRWNIPYVEDARYFDHILDTSGYTFNNGQWKIPTKPGWGFELVPDYSAFLAEKELTIS